VSNFQYIKKFFFFKKKKPHRNLLLSILLYKKDAYGSGANEILISNILKDRRDEVFICTKFGIVRDSNVKYVGVTNVSGKPEYARQACENSLKRLGVDCIDLYYQHRVDPET
jgi:aryl-alcohol dehydrogenase-like predicted oxidoreductase